MKQARRTLFALVCGVAIGAAGLAVLRPPVANSSGGIVGVSVAEAALDRPIPEIWLTNVPFQEAVRKVAELSGASVAIDEASFRRTATNLNKPVTVKTRNVSVGEVLEDLAAAMSEPDKPVWATADDDRIVMAVVEGPNVVVKAPTRMYDVRDLVEMIIRRKPDFFPDLVSFAGGPIPARVTTMTRQEVREELIRLLQETVAPDTWRETGGSIGAIYSLGDHLIVTQTLESHREVRRLFEDIRRLAGPFIPPGPPLPESFHFAPEKNKWISYSRERGEAKLRQVLPEFRSDDEPLWQAVERLAKSADITLAADTTLDLKLRDIKVSVGTRSATIGQTLRALLNAAVAKSKTSGVSVDELGWWLRGEVVVIGTEETAGKCPLLRIYDVRDWLVSSQAPATQSATDLPPPTVTELLEGFSELLKTHVANETWQLEGGQPGIIRQFGGQLFVTQTVENHEHVQRFIEAFRHPVLAPLPRDTTPIAEAERSRPPADEVPEVFARVYGVRPHLAILLGEPVTRDVRRSRDYIIARELLLKTITDNVDVDSWKENGGMTGTIREVAGQLVVTQTPQGHLAVSKVLNELLRSEGAMKELVDDKKTRE